MLELQEPIAGRYLLQQCLYHGSMSYVYLAYDELLQREVAIKLVSNDQPESKQRLQSEIQTLSKLSHEHILAILDHGEYGAYHYLVMPYLKHGTLRNRLARGRLMQEEAGNILLQVTGALQYAHDNGMVHRDIKPSNILLNDITNLRVYLADFGLAKLMDKGSDLTQTGYLIGTPAYMAPELIDKPESVSSDIYALGVLLYHMLTGRVPFTGDSPLGVYWKHLHELPLSPSQLNPAITSPVEQVIMRALNKDPGRRFPSAQALAKAYMSALQASINKNEVAHLGDRAFEPAQTCKVLKKKERIALPAMSLTKLPKPRWQNPRNNIQQTIISSALVALFIIPLSLGFIVGRASAPLPLAYKAQIVADRVQATGTLQQSSLAPTRQTTWAVHPASGNTILPQFTLSIPEHKHGHHHHKNKNED